MELYVRFPFCVVQIASRIEKFLVISCFVVYCVQNLCSLLSLFWCPWPLFFFPGPVIPTGTETWDDASSIYVKGSQKYGFRCPVCDKWQRSKAILESHMRMHTGEKPFACEVCSKQFSLKSNWKRHMLSVHPDYEGNFRLFPETMPTSALTFQ